MLNNNEIRAAASRRSLILLALLALIAAVVGCGGGGGGSGGGGGGATVTVTGTVLRAETGVAPNPAATITIGGQSATSSTSDGTFTISGVPESATTLTVAAQGAQMLTQKVNLTTPVTGVVNVGTLYTSDTGYNASVTGVVMTATSNPQPVGGAVVTIAGVSTTTSSSGSFTINGLAVGLGSVANEPLGQVTATGYTTKPITSSNFQFALAAGSNNIGTILISSAQISSSAPPPPYTITGLVTVAGAPPTSSATVLLTQNGSNIAQVSTNAAGAYYFWVVPGTYTVTVDQGSNSKTASVTLKSLTSPVTVPTIAF